MGIRFTDVKVSDGAPQVLDKDRLPPGHARFQEQGCSAVIVYNQTLYDGRGRRLRHDVKWLRANNYTVCPTMIQMLKPHQKKREYRECVECSFPSLPVSSKFCSECGARQPELVWTPGAGGDGEELKKLIDPSDPFGSLAALESEPEVSERSVVRMPTEEELLQEAVSEFSASYVGVDGRPMDSNPQLSVKQRGQVGFKVPAPSNRKAK